jgi:hypothetical protein
MRKFIAFIILLLYSLGPVYCQQNMSKDEILNYFKKFEEKRSVNKDSIKFIRFNTELEQVVKNLTDSLEKANIDTLIIYSVSFPGSITAHYECINLLYPIDVYVFWKQGIDYFEKQIKYGCILETQKSMSSNSLEYYIKNQLDFNDDIFMPVIYSAVLKEDSIMTYSSGSVDHEPKYSLYLKCGENFTQKIFTEYEITNKENMFYEYNLNLKTYYLYKIIESQIQ